MKTVTFYLLDKEKPQRGDSFECIKKIVCELTTKHWGDGRNILIFCENEKQAIHLDEALWINTTDRFVPHNLIGEGLNRGTPIEIAWKERCKSTPRDLLINLGANCIDLFLTFTEIIDFVPCTNSLKKLARERYKAFRMAGFNINTTIWK